MLPKLRPFRRVQPHFAGLASWGTPRPYPATRQPRPQEPKAPPFRILLSPVPSVLSSQSSPAAPPQNLAPTHILKSCPFPLRPGLGVFGGARWR